MTTSSQTPSGALPPESPQAARSAPPTPAGMFAAYGAVLPVPLGAAPVAQQAAPSTAPDVPGVTQEAGVAFSRETVQGIANTAYRLGVVDAEAAATELAQLGAQDPETLDWFYARLLAVAALCAGRPHDDLLTVREVLAAVDGRTATTAPLAIQWGGTVRGLVGDAPYEDTVVPCTTARGGPAALVLTDAERLKLGSLLATPRTAEACQTPGCGITDDELDQSNPFVQGWIRVDVVGTDSAARWWCSVWCANSAITAGGAELAAADRAAAVDPDAQAPITALPGDTVVLHRFEPELLGESDATRRVAQCRHCAGARTDAVHIWADDDQAATGGAL